MVLDGGDSVNVGSGVHGVQGSGGSGFGVRGPGSVRSLGGLLGYEWSVWGSAPANLSEGFGRYRPRDNARFVRTAIASLIETINHLGHAFKQQIISKTSIGTWCTSPSGQRARQSAISSI